MNVSLALPAASLAATLALAGGAGAQSMPVPPASAALLVPRVPVLTITSADQADAQAYVAVARRSLATCGLVGAQPPAALQQRYIVAVGDLTSNRYALAETASRDVIDQCAALPDVAATTAPAAAN
jgi:hypothetical protein